MQYTNLSWRDGQPYSERFDDIYYSSSDTESIPGENEFKHVFFSNNGLPERWNNNVDFIIAELGFGSGLNCILTIREWLNHLAKTQSKKCLHYIAIEKFPLSPQAITEIISRYPQLKTYCDEIVNSYPPAVEAAHTRYLFNNRVAIHYRFMDVFEALQNERLNVDAWYLDGFSPAKNAAMWSLALFEKLAQNSHPGTRCSTYTSAGFVKRNLQAAGFSVKKVSGYGRKREMLTAVYNRENNTALKYSDKPWFFSPPKARFTAKKATVIGAGIAGLTIALALIKRGWRITLIDRQNGVAKETSANPAAVSYPRLSVNNDTDTAFYTAAFCYNLHSLHALAENSQQIFCTDSGLLQLMDKTRSEQIIKKFDFNNKFFSIKDELFCSKNIILPSVISTAQSFVFYKTATVVQPPVLCNALKQECGESLNFIQAEISNVKHDGEKWCCYSSNQLCNEAQVLIVASGVDVNELGLPLTFPLQAIRGQAAELNANASSIKIQHAINTGFYLTPAINSKHYLGATYKRDSGSLETTKEENDELFSSLNDYFQGVFKKEDICDAWAGFRSMSKDRVPIVGAVCDPVYVKEYYGDICHGKANKDYPPVKYLPGLYISAAHGSRGFTTSFLAAEIIAAMIEGEPLPVTKKVIDYISPSRFIVNNLKRG